MKIQWTEIDERNIEEFTVKQWEGTAPELHYGILPFIGECDEEGKEEYGGNFWWELYHSDGDSLLVQDEGAADTFEDAERQIVDAYPAFLEDVIACYSDMEDDESDPDEESAED